MTEIFGGSVTKKNREPVNSKEVYGLDLSGYSEKPALAHARESDEVINVTIYTNHPFENVEEWQKVPSKGEREFIEKEISDNCHLYVDCPLDLSPLDCPKIEKTFRWELYSRPIDQAFNSLRPMASYLGALVYRFKNLLHATQKTNEIGKKVFETYPAAFLELAKETQKKLREAMSNPEKKGDNDKLSYKSEEDVTFNNGKWEPEPLTKGKESPKERAEQRKKEALAGIANALNIKPAERAEESKLSHDDLDAIICAVTGLYHIENDELLAVMKKRLREQTNNGNHDKINAMELPKGYRLADPKNWPKSIVISRQKWESNT